MTRFFHALLALIPLLLTPALIYALAEGILDFGGGEKDVILALPWLLWSVAFALCAFVLIYHRWDIDRWALRSALVASAVLAGLGIITYVGGFLGIA